MVWRSLNDVLAEHDAYVDRELSRYGRDYVEDMHNPRKGPRIDARDRKDYCRDWYRKNGKDICACGNTKDRRATTCAQCYRDSGRKRFKREAAE